MDYMENNNRHRRTLESHEETELRSYTSAIWMTNSRINSYLPTVNSFVSYDNNLTCCHRATWCEPNLRDIIVTKPVFKNYWNNLTYAKLFWMVTVAAIFLMSYVIAYLYIGESVLPGGTLFGLMSIIIFAYVLGWLLAYLPYLHLPPVFGMLLAGIIVRNADLYDIHKDLSTAVLSKIRIFSLTFVMLRAGLQLTSSGIREHPLFLINLAIVPCTLELVAVAGCCRLILEFPWSWSFLTGSIIACISPVVPINCILSLAEKGYGEDKDIATLLFAAASIDDIHIMSIYSFHFAVIFSEEKQYKEWWSYIPGGIRDFLMGSIVGSIFGIFFVFFPHRNQPYVLWYRITCLILAALVCTIATTKIAITGGSFLATILMSLIATTGWRILSVPFDVEPLRKIVHVMWHFMQPVLVGVISADIDFSDWSLSTTALYLLCITLGLIVRCIFAFLATFHTPFNLKERFFISLSWFAKGTIQAVLGSMVLEQAELINNPVDLKFAVEIFRISIISIVVFAPLGALIMMMTGPSLLTKTDDDIQRKRRELSYMKIVSLQPVRGRRV